MENNNNNQNLTVWQKLSKTFGPDGTLGQGEPDYRLDKSEILKTKDKAEYEREKLQKQQSHRARDKLWALRHHYTSHA